MGREKERERDLSSLPIVHRALIYVFVIYILLEYPAGASKELFLSIRLCYILKFEVKKSF